MSDHGAIRELLPLYVLGALDGTSDCDAVCTHLASGCPSCAAELAEHARVAAALAVSLPPVAPRESVRSSLQSRLASTPADEPDVQPASNVMPFPLRAWPMALAATVAAVGILAAFYYQDALRVERNSNYQVSIRLGETEARERALRESMLTNREVIAALANPSKTSISSLAATKDHQGTGAIVWDKSAKKWILVAKGMKALPAGKAYELWFIAGNEKVAAGTFRVDANGDAIHVIDVPARLDKIDVGAVTDEPEGGVTAPTGEIQIAGKIS